MLQHLTDVLVWLESKMSPRVHVDGLAPSAVKFRAGHWAEIG